MKYVNEMVPNFQTVGFSEKGKEKGSNTGLIDNITLF